MSSSDSSESSSSTCKDTELIWVANFVKKNPVILNKSQVPTIKTKKQEALEKLKTCFEQQFGKITSVKKILKRLNNLKSCIKKKTDKNATGNKKIKLSAAESILYEVMEGDSGNCNPVLNKIAGKLHAGLPDENQPAQKSNNELVSRQLQLPPPPLLTTPKKHKILEAYETEETRNLSNSDLQRLVLLEQLHVLRMKKKKLEDESRQKETGTSIFEDSDGTDYRIL